MNTTEHEHAGVRNAEAIGPSRAGCSLLRWPDVQRRLGDSRTTNHERVRRGLMVKPVKVGRTALYPSAEVEAIVAARLAQISDASMLDLVDRLHARRQEAFQGVLQALTAAETSIGGAHE
jgi:prophage regulatory protein